MSGRRLRRSVNNVILSGRYTVFGEKLREYGYHVIFSETVPMLIPYEQQHADMQCLIVDNTAFVLKECPNLVEQLKQFYHVIVCKENVGGEYPQNVPLNAAVVGKYLIANLRSLSSDVKEYCLNHGYQLVHVNQGYAKCSCAIISEDALITADEGIYRSLIELKIDVLKIRQGRVNLKGADYGFIGGASGQDKQGQKRILWFSGDIKKHPDHVAIAAFCRKHGTEIRSLTDGELTDIGGMMFC